MLKAKIVVHGLLSIPFLATSALASPFGTPVREFGGATPVGESRWITASDYPESPVRLQLQGRVIVAFAIGADGKITRCNVEGSSGSPKLDEVPCRLLQRRARFKPKVANDGAAVESKGRYSVDFWIPE
jgi:protein TonB